MSKVISALDQLAERANNLSKNFNDAGGQFAILRDNAEKLSYSQDKLAASPMGANAAKIKAEWDKFITGAQETILGAFVPKTGEDDKTQEQKDREAGKAGLTGNSLVEYEKLKRSRIELEKSLAMDRAAFERDIFTQRRDYAIEIKEFERGVFQERRDFELEERETEIQFARQKQDIERDAAIEQRDYTIERQKLDEDFEFKQGEKKFAIDREIANRDHSNKQKDAKEDFDLKQDYAAKELARDEKIRKEDTERNIADKKLEYDKERQIQQRDFGIGQANKARDFGYSQADKAQDFGINVGRNAEDFKDKLVDMRISGASSISYFQAARDYNKQQSRAAVDYSVEKNRNERDFKTSQSDAKVTFENQQSDAAKNIGIEIAKTIRDSMIEQQRANEKFQIDKEKEQTEFDISQGRSNRDFGNEQQDALRAHALEVESHYYDKRYQALELENKHNDTVEKTNIELERLAEDLSIAREKLANRKSDMDFQEALGREKLANKKNDLDYNEGVGRERLDIEQAKARRSQDEAEMDFAGGLRDQSPYLADEVAKNDPRLRELLDKDAARKKQTKLSDLVKQTNNDFTSTAGQVTGSIGSIITNPGKALGDLFLDKTGLRGSLRPVIDNIKNSIKSNDDPTKLLTGNPDLIISLLKNLGVPGFATGGFIARDQIAQLHAGEYVINPNSPDKARQEGLLGGLTQAMSLKGFGGGSNQLIANPMPLTGLGGSNGGGVSAGERSISFGGNNFNISGMSGGMLKEFKSMVNNHQSELESKVNRFMGNMPSQIADYEKLGHRV